MARVAIALSFALVATHAFTPPLTAHHGDSCLRRQHAVAANGEKPRFTKISSANKALPRTRSLLLADSSQPPPTAVAELTAPGGTVLTAFLVGIWYAASVVCNQTSKVLVASLGSQTLTLMQMIVAVGCGAIVLFVMRAFCALALDGECAFKPIGIESRDQLIDTTILAVRAPASNQ